MTKIGTRVVAIQKADEKKAFIYGIGEYVGDQIPEKGLGFFTDMLNEASVANPTIKLDSGDTVYGCECWWGPEQILEKYPEYEVVSINEDRKLKLD